MSEASSPHATTNRSLLAPLLSWLVGLDGVFVLATTLFYQISAHHSSRLSDIVIDVPIVLGLSFIYLSTLLARRKMNAWIVTILAYTFTLGLNTTYLLQPYHTDTVVGVIRNLVVPLIILLLLVISRAEFSVRSDIAAFQTSLRFTILILLVTLAYGVGGFLLLDKSDYHQEISIPEAFQRTIDQFDLTTNHPLHAYTKRAHLFGDSLSFISIGSLVYVVASFFQPVRLRLRNQTVARQQLLELMGPNAAPSEDFFKLWPHDKQYFFEHSGQAGTAYLVRRGVALSLGDPVAKASKMKSLLAEFDNLCYGNDWLPAFIHVEAKYRKYYKAAGYSMQLIGQEAVLDLSHFSNSVYRNKYFRNITNRFNREAFSVEIVEPPHSKALIQRLQIISNEWLARPGRSERGFVMGYFSEEYMQQCPLVVARDAAGTIQGFMNLVPAAFDTKEATFDMMRHTAQSPGNINDYMLLYLSSYLHEQGYLRLNLGLSPLVGLDTAEGETGLIATVLRFAYINGDRFYSFSGLHRFKDKYEPEWTDRYVAYKGGVRGFSRTMNALLRAMSIKTKS